MFWFLAAAVAITCAYQGIATLAALRQWRRRAPPLPDWAPGLSVLKPVRGVDPQFAEAIRSHASQEYPGEVEILFGVADPQDPAIAVIEAMAAEFPGRAIRVIRSTTTMPNAKVGVLIDLAREARYDLLLVNDGDILVPPGYLREVTAPLLAEASLGLVTCLYRARGESLAARWEALGIAVDFMPSVLVAPLVGVKEFGLGATLVFRREELAAIGGFAAIGPYLADDYLLAKKITGLGKPAQLSRVVVDTALGAGTWGDVWRHQVRWARTIRASRGDGYAGLPVTQAGVWALLALLAGMPGWAAAAVAARWLSAYTGGALALDHDLARRAFWLAPLWDLWAFGVWLAGLGGRTVEWRGRRLTLGPDGRIEAVTEQG